MVVTGDIGDGDGQQRSVNMEIITSNNWKTGVNVVALVNRF